MFEGIVDEIEQRTGVDTKSIKRVLSTFMLILRDRSIFMCWQRVIDRGSTGQAIIVASTTNIRMEEIKFPITSKIVHLEGTVRGMTYAPDDNIHGLEAERLAPPPKQLENRS